MDVHNSEFNGNPLKIQCTCSYDAYIFPEKFGVSSITQCKKCGKKIYSLECTSCQNGFYYPEESIPKIAKYSQWRCEICKKDNPLPEDIPTNYIKNFHLSEIPQEVQTKMFSHKKQRIKALFIGAPVMILIGIAIAIIPIIEKANIIIGSLAGIAFTIFCIQQTFELWRKKLTEAEVSVEQYKGIKWGAILLIPALFLLEMFRSNQNLGMNIMFGIAVFFTLYGIFIFFSAFFKKGVYAN